MTMPQMIARSGSVSTDVQPIPPWLMVLPRALRTRVKDFFAYTANFLPLTANLTQSQQISIQNDADFLITYATLIETDTTNLTLLTFTPMLVQLSDTGSGRNFFDNPTHVMNVFGDAENPAYFSYPKLLKAGATFTVQLTNLEATDRNVRIAFHGFKIFPYEE